MSLQVDDVMTKDVITIGRDYPVKYAESLMSYFGVDCLIVMEGHSPIGIITTGDITERVLEKTLDPHIVHVGEAMSSPLVSVPNGTAVNVAVDIMLEHGIMRLPIIGDSHLVGLLTRVEMPSMDTLEVHAET